jgi:hypothetical protein
MQDSCTILLQLKSSPANQFRWSMVPIKYPSRPWLFSRTLVRCSMCGTRKYHQLIAYTVYPPLRESHMSDFSFQKDRLSV